MAKLLLILLVGLVFEAAGVVLLKKGINQIGEVQKIVPAEVFRITKAGATNPTVLLGVFFEALFFACLLILMSKSDITFLWPLTALSFVMTTFAALVFLGEKVSPVRKSRSVLSRVVYSISASRAARSASVLSSHAGATKPRGFNPAA